jgi:hypothetical protein
MSNRKSRVAIPPLRASELHLTSGASSSETGRPQRKARARGREEPVAARTRRGAERRSVASFTVIPRCWRSGTLLATRLK